MMQVRVTGLKEVQSFLNKLPKNMQKEFRDNGIPKITKELHKSIQFHYTMAGYGTGISNTGYTFDTIKWKKTELGAMITLGEEASLIEKGVPSHYVSQNLIEFRKSNPAFNTIGKTAKDLGIAPPYNGPPFYWIYKGPFVKPALEQWKNQLSNKLKRYLDKAIKQSGGKT